MTGAARRVISSPRRPREAAAVVRPSRPAPRGRVGPDNSTDLRTRGSHEPGTAVQRDALA